MQRQLFFRLGYYPACACAAGVKQCFCVCVCVRVSAKNIEKCFKQGCKGVYRHHSQQNNQHNHTRTFLYLIQVQAILYAVISATSYYWFVAPPLAKSHVVVTVSNATRTPIRENTGGIDLATYGEARGVKIP